MTEVTIALLAVVALFVLVLSGVHIGFALLLTSFVAMIFIGSLDMASSLLAASAYHAILDYVFAVVPLFILMGSFMTRSRAAQGLYTFLNIVFNKIRGGLAVATVFANAVFAAVTGASVASAAVFSKIALPEMYRYGYSRRLALGSVAGSSVLGMLIPPSLLLIVYGILTQTSIGALFVAGIVPGLLLSLIYAVGIVVTGYLRPATVGRGAEVSAPVAAAAAPPEAEEGARRGGVDDTSVEGEPAGGRGEPRDERAADDAAEAMRRLEAESEAEDESLLRAMLGSLPVVGLVALVLGGIWGGWFSPTEAAGVGALGAFVIGKFMGMTWRGVIGAFRDTAVTTGAIMILLISAQMYSRMLASSGLIAEVGAFITGLEVSPLTIMIIFLLIIVVLGAVLDSVSIILLAVPVMFPTMQLLDIDPLWFGIIIVVAVELGLLTPPFGMIPFTMSAVIGRSVSVEEIFAGSFPFFLMMVLLIVLMLAFPPIVTWLPSLM